MSAHRSRVSSIVAAATLALFAPSIGHGQSPATTLVDSARTLIDRATRASDLEGLRSAQALLERVTVASPSDAWAMHYQGFALYREATLRMGRDNADVRALLERADSILERSAKLKAVPETHALRSSVLGMMIGSNPLRGMMLGPRSGSQMERAVELGPANPRVWLLRGIGAINTPSMFGGGADKAETYIKKAIELFANDHPQSPAPAWGLAEAHIWLGQAYAKQSKIDLARASYERALALEPESDWVRMVLLPALDQKKK
jgi:tetratricopeptide (TPR) repeat protein